MSSRRRVKQERQPELNVHILTTGSWPTPQDDPDKQTRIPPVVEPCCESFKILP